jgi:hypothetical protein
MAGASFFVPGCGGRTRSTAIHLVAPAYPHHENTHNIVLNVTNHPNVSDAITPDPGKPTAQSLASLPRVIKHRDVLFHIVEYATSYAPVQPVQLAPGRFSVLNPPDQVLF